LYGISGSIDYTLNYSIDGKYNGPIPLVINYEGLHVITQGTGLVNLPELSEGKHRLTIYTEADIYNNGLFNFPGSVFKPKINSDGTVYYSASYDDTVYFYIDSTPPNMSILSPENKTYTAADIPLNFTVDENVSQVTYSLDGNDNTTIAGNTTLTGLSTGSHNVTMYARDVAGNTGASETIYFAIAEEQRQEPEPEPFPTILVVASVASVAVVSAGLLSYFKKRKH